MEPELRARLDRVAAREGELRETLVTRMLGAVAPTRWFSAFYRRFGPMVDPWLLRVTGGRAYTHVYGFPTLLLITTGAKTGKARTSPLLYVRDGDDFLVVGTNFGTEHHPAWTRNLLATPAATVELFDERISVQARLLDPVEFERHWPAFVAIYPGYAAYLERLEHRAPRMFRLVPVSA